MKSWGKYTTFVHKTKKAKKEWYSSGWKCVREKNFCSLVIKQLMVIRKAAYTTHSLTLAVCLYWHKIGKIGSKSGWYPIYTRNNTVLLGTNLPNFLTDFPSGQFALYYVVVQGIWGRIVSARFSCAGRTLGIRDWCSL